MVSRDILDLQMLLYKLICLFFSLTLPGNLGSASRNVLTSKRSPKEEDVSTKRAPLLKPHRSSRRPVLGTMALRNLFGKLKVLRDSP